MTYFRADNLSRHFGGLTAVLYTDLLQLFGTSRKAGVLVLRSGGREGRIYLNDGRIRFAEFAGVANVPPLKALYRMLHWQNGSFALDHVREPVGHAVGHASTDRGPR